jgi:predicted glycosyl hydrolase (DUF1957 family)
MEELRKEFEKKIGYVLTETRILYPTETQKWAIVEILIKYIDFLEQKLSKQAAEEEFKKFMLKVYNDWRNNPDKTAIDYMLERIFSHYILIPKED